MSRSVNKAVTATLLTDLYLDQKLSIPQIARILNIPRTAVRTALLKAGIERRSRGDGIRLRVDAIRESSRGHTYRCSPETRKKMSLKRLEWSKKHAKGVRITPLGYMEYTVGPHKGRSVHVVIAEIQILGRRLAPGELVHHKDKNRLNNKVENLQVMTRSAHATLHATENHLKRKRRNNGTFA